MNRNYTGFRGFLLLWGLLFVQGVVTGQESILLSYKRNFFRANLAAKADILRDAATDERAPEFIGELYEFALDFILPNAGILREDPDSITLLAIASRGLGDAGYTAGVDTLLKVFSAFPDSIVRVEALRSLALLGKGNARVVESLNQFLAEENNRFRSGISPDYSALSACINALAGVGDGTSFPALFSVVTAGYPASITGEAVRALDSIAGDFKQYLIEVIRGNPPGEKLAAFTTGVNNRKFTGDERGEMAEIALAVALELYPGTETDEAAAAELRYQAVRVLRDMKWTRASGLAVKHFYRVQKDYGSGTASTEQLVAAIGCLGAMGSAEAAQALALQLGYINSHMEGSGEYDETVTLEVIRALGEIGDKVSFDYLLYINYLAYPEKIQVAAKDALSRLKW